MVTLQDKIKQDISADGICMFMKFKELNGSFEKIEIGLLVQLNIELSHGEPLDPISAVIEGFDEGKDEVYLRISRENGMALRRRTTNLEKLSKNKKLRMLNKVH